MPELTMTSRERVIRAIHRRPTDVIPVGPFLFDIAASYHGVTVGEFAVDGRLMGEAQVALQKELGQDIVFVGLDNYYIAAGFGCRINIPEDETPNMAEPAVERLRDVYRLEVPDPHTDGRMPVMLEATRYVRDALGDSICIRTPGTGPFALASYLVGTEDFLLEVGLAEAGAPEADPDAIHHALGLAADALIAFGKACWDAGADLLHCGDSLASCDMISPAQYERWAFPYQKKVIRAWRDHGARTLLHICGDSTRVLDSYAATGAHVVEIDHKVDLALAKERIGDRTCILGNVDPVATLLFGRPDDARTASENCIAVARRGGAYILGSGCMVPRTAPLENLRAMVDTARSHENRWDR